jgi:hypothetical protein
MAFDCINHLVSGFIFKATHYMYVERPERYVKQLNSHLSKKAALQEGFLLFPGLGAGEASVSETNTIRLAAFADNRENLEKIQEILSKHLYKFAKKTEELGEVTWQREH